ncbi:MAG: transcriptional regulator NrdR [Limnochordales bacterium]
MRCPYCHHMDSKVLDSRATDEGASIRRRRECERCGRRFTTYERWEETPLMVIKKDGRREPFQRQKILTGLMKACEKRPIPVAVLEQIVDDIEREARQRGDTEITSRQIGERGMEALRGIDEVGYVRFASVYREFRDLTALLGEVQKLVRRE